MYSFTLCCIYACPSIGYVSLISSLPGQSPLEHFLVSWPFPSHSRLSSFCPVLGKTQVPVLLCLPPPHETEQSVHGDQRHWPPDKTNRNINKFSVCQPVCIHKKDCGTIHAANILRSDPIFDSAMGISSQLRSEKGQLLERRLISITPLCSQFSDSLCIFEMS